MKIPIPVKEITHNKLIELQEKLKANKTHRKFAKNMNKVLKFLLDYFSFAELERRLNKELEKIDQQLELLDNNDKELNNHIVVKKKIYDETLKLVYSFRASETHRKFGRSLNYVIEFLLSYFYTDQAIKSGDNKTILDNL